MAVAPPGYPDLLRSQLRLAGDASKDAISSLGGLVQDVYSLERIFNAPDGSKSPPRRVINAGSTEVVRDQPSVALDDMDGHLNAVKQVMTVQWIWS